MGASAPSGHRGGPLHGGAVDAGQRLARGGPLQEGPYQPSPIPVRCDRRTVWTASSRVDAPNVLVVADFTYMRLAGGAFVYIALVIDAYTGRIVGWQCYASKHTAFIESAMRQAADMRSS